MSPTLFIPQHYEKHYRYPLIVWIPSDGEDSRRLFANMARLSLRNYVGVAIETRAANHPHADSATSICDAKQQMLQAIDYARLKMSIADQRIYLAGKGSGGTLAFRLAFACPDVVAGVISLNGPLPSGETPLCNWWQCRSLPVFWSHSRRGEAFHEDELCRQLALLHTAGFNVTLRQYPCGEDVPSKALSDVNCWIMESIESAIH